MITRLSARAALAFFTLFTYTSCDNGKADPLQQTQTEVNAQDKEQVEEQVRLYIQAFNNGDINKIADFFSEDAIYKNPITGALVQGRDGIKKELVGIIERLKGAKIEFQIKKIRFPMEGKASEEGVITLLLPGRKPIHSDYKMIHVKKNGKWQILHVSQLDFGMLQNNSDDPSHH